ncbi:hypothetical protein B0H21DRAFT_780825 [Amylocystis lapponica]|nr:hypothetical protein B0H21DRAFT_780825 [Amylocystis lapponica]
MHVAILGGGLTGLSSAFHLARRFPRARITLLEKAPRLGGWVRSERVVVKGSTGEASVLLEAGPRTLRPGALALLELINLLNLTPHLLTVPRTAPAALNRFLHLPGTRGLQRIPTSLPALLTSPLARILVPALLRDAVGHAHTPDPEGGGGADESVEAFLTRHFGAEFARTFGSALVHGVRAAFPVLRDLSERGYGSVVRGVLRGAFSRRKPEEEEGYELGGVYSFREGMETLVRALQDNLKGGKMTVSRVLRAVGAEKLTKTQMPPDLDSVRHDPDVLAPRLGLPLPALDALLRTSAESSAAASTILPPLPHIARTLSSSVTVVNLVFPGGRPLHPPGFGYLVPRPAGGYAPPPPRAPTSARAPLGILGTVFDSCALGAQDAGAPVTKLTVMLGGPHPPTDGDGEGDAGPLLRALARHLGARAPLPAPLLVRAGALAGCIPTPRVGHGARMDAVRAGAGAWGRAEVLGAGVGGVSVGACVEMGRGAGRGWGG